MSAVTSITPDKRRLKSLARNIVELERASLGLPVIGLQDVQARTGRLLPSYQTRQVDGSVKRARPGDVLFGKLRPYLAKALTVRQPVLTVSEFLVLRPGPGIQAEYLEYLLRSDALIHRVTALSAGAKMPRVEWPTLGPLEIPIPGLGDQALAVRYLRRLEFGVAKAIESKRRLANLLDERRRAISQSLVTEGLTPADSTKPSGIPWLPDVPAHWEIRPAKSLYSEVNERSLRGEEQLMSVSHLTGVTPRATKNVTMFMAATYVGHKVCRSGDLVINTMWAWMGALGVATETGLVSPAYGVYRPLRSSPLLPSYADLLLRTRPYIDEYTCRSTGIRSSRLRLYPDRFLTIPVLCPPPSEQVEIVARVREATHDIAAAMTTCLKEVSLLEEYRTKLVADVISGQLDLSNIAADLPDVDQAELDSVLSSASPDDDVEDEAE